MRRNSQSPGSFFVELQHETVDERVEAERRLSTHVVNTAMIFDPKQDFDRTSIDDGVEMVKLTS